MLELLDLGLYTIVDYAILLFEFVGVVVLIITGFKGISEENQIKK